MSLLNQTARYLLLTALAIALVGSVGFYTLIHWKIRFEVDEILMDQVKLVTQSLRQHPSQIVSDKDDNPRVTLTQKPVRPTYTDTTIIDSVNIHGRLMPIRQLRTTVLANGKLYLIRVQQPYYEFNELAREMSVGVIIGFLLLMALSVAVGLGLSSRLWHPFYATIQQLGDFQLDQPTPAPFPISKVREFTLLSRSLTELTQKLRRQFSLQKQFTENASHELQTPLAIASAELDQLLQSEQLTERDHMHLQRATHAISRMSQLNRSLLLLTQLENNQFTQDEWLDISALLSQHVAEYEPFFEHKAMHLQQQIQPQVMLRLNRQLASVLVTNLLKNAARHGRANGNIRIALTDHSLLIQNTGNPLPFADSALFSRFVKDPARADSTGLGLALVKQIVDRYNLTLHYAYDTAQQSHSFQISWPVARND